MLKEEGREIGKMGRKCRNKKLGCISSCWTVYKYSKVDSH